MYIPEQFRETDREALHDLIRQNSFGTLVSHREGEMIASHLPFLLDPERGAHGTLLGHMARANPQWQGFHEGVEALAIFTGPHAYISPSWYQAKLSVPTWNYVAVHVYGVPQVIEERAALVRILTALVDTYEAAMETPWKLELPDDYMTGMLKGIVGFEIPISRLEGKLKLSQNRPEADRDTVPAALRQLGDPMSVQIAALMDEDRG